MRTLLPLLVLLAASCAKPLEPVPPEGDTDSDADAAAAAADTDTDTDTGLGSIRAITIDGDIADFGDPLCSDGGADIFVSIDEDDVHVAVTGFDLANAHLHVVFSVPDDGTATDSHFSYDFVAEPWSFLVSIYGTSNVCYYPFDGFGSPQCVDPGSWPHHAGYTANPTTELSIPRGYLGTGLADPVGVVDMGLWVTNDAGDAVLARCPVSNPLGGSWSDWEPVDFPTYEP